MATQLFIHPLLVILHDVFEDFERIEGSVVVLDHGKDKGEGFRLLEQHCVANWGLKIVGSVQ